MMVNKFLGLLLLISLASCSSYETGKDIQKLENKIDSLNKELLLTRMHMIDSDTTLRNWAIQAEKAILENKKTIDGIKN